MKFEFHITSIYRVGGTVTGSFLFMTVNFNLLSLGSWCAVA